MAGESSSYPRSCKRTELTHTHTHPGKFRLGLIQLAVGANKATNLERAEKLIREAAGQGANVIALPVSSAKLIEMRTQINTYVTNVHSWSPHTHTGMFQLSIRCKILS